MKRNEVQSAQAQSKMKLILSSIGAGAVLMSAVMGPGSLATMLVTGSQYGNSMLWVTLLAVILSGVIAYVGGKIACVKNKNLYEFFEDEIGKVFTLVLLGVVLITWSLVIFSQGKTLLTTVQFLSGTEGTLSFLLFIAVEIIIGYVFTSGKNNAQNIASAMVTLLSIMFLVNIFVIKPNVGSVAVGLLPKLPKWSEAAIIASIIGSSAPGTSAGWYSFSVIENKHDNPNKLRDIAIDQTYYTTIFGIFCIGAYLSASEILYPLGIKVNNAIDAATALEPVAGKFASYIISIGFFGALFTTVGGMGSFLAKGVRTFYKISTNHSKEDNVYEKIAKHLIWVGILISILGGFVPGSAMQYLVGFIGLLTVGGSIITILVFYYTSSEKHMGEYKNGILLNILCILLVLVNGYSAISVLLRLLS